jgi:hypothetical protein
VLDLSALTCIALAPELKRLYKLYSHLPTGLLPPDDTKYGMTAVSKMVKDHIESVGNDLVKGQIGRTDGGDEFINQLIALHTKYATLVEECFQDHALFQKALKEVRPLQLQLPYAGCLDVHLTQEAAL